MTARSSPSVGSASAPIELPGWCTLVRCDNPSPMTLSGTNTYVLRAPDAADAAGEAGASGAIVIDPGPLHEGHLRTVAAIGDVALVLLTHGHPDHAEGAHLFQEMTGAPMAAVLPGLTTGAEVLRDGARFAGVAGLDLAVVATPGHTTDSVSFLVTGDRPALLTGDTILGRGTTVVAHPDGRLGPYLASLVRIREMGPLLLLPGHGPVGPDTSASAAAYLAHRAQRLDQVRAARAAGDRSAGEVVRRVYADVDESLWPAAELSVRAQLKYLDETAGAQPR
jgi:glyoxylase-like metal-dependent hydrolase (beta-lactamase superfamily II)